MMQTFDPLPTSTTTLTDNRRILIIDVSGYVTPLLDTNIQIVGCAPLRAPSRPKLPSLDVLHPADFFQRSEMPQLLEFVREVDRDLQLAQMRSRSAFEDLLARARSFPPRAPVLKPRRAFSKFVPRPGFRGSRESKRLLEAEQSPGRRSASRR